MTGDMLRVRNWNLTVISRCGEWLNTGGSTYCSIASLSMLGALRVEDMEDTVRWLAALQIQSETSSHGAFSGRVNKPADTCYSFWVGGTLDVRHPYTWHSLRFSTCYIMFPRRRQTCIFSHARKTQSSGDSEKSRMRFLVHVLRIWANLDPLHSCLGLASLSLCGESELLHFDATLCITKRAKGMLDNAPWRTGA